MPGSEPNVYNRWAVWALPVALLWGFGILSFIGMLLGIVAMWFQYRRKDSEATQQRGAWRAWLAISFGFVTTLLSIVHIQTILKMVGF